MHIYIYTYIYYIQAYGGNGDIMGNITKDMIFFGLFWVCLKLMINHWIGGVLGSLFFRTNLPARSIVSNINPIYKYG